MGHLPYELATRDCRKGHHPTSFKQLWCHTHASRMLCRYPMPCDPPVPLPGPAPCYAVSAEKEKNAQQNQPTCRRECRWRCGARTTNPPHRAPVRQYKEAPPRAASVSHTQRTWRHVHPSRLPVVVVMRERSSQRAEPPPYHVRHTAAAVEGATRRIPTVLKRESQWVGKSQNVVVLVRTAVGCVSILWSASPSDTEARRGPVSAVCLELGRGYGPHLVSELI